MKFLKTQFTQSVIFVFSLLSVLQLFGMAWAQEDLGPSVIGSVSWRPDGTELAVGQGPQRCGEDGDYSVHIVDAQTNQVNHELNFHECIVISLDWSPDGTRLVTTSIDGTAATWDTITWQRVSFSQPFSQGERITDIWNSTGTEIAAIANGVPYIKVWDPTNGDDIDTISSPDALPTALDWNPAGDELVTGGHDFNIRIWNRDSQENTLTLQGHTAIISTIDWHPTGNRLASGSSDQTVRIWDTALGQQMYDLQGHAGYIRTVRWSPDGQIVASSSDDGTIRTWNASTGQPIQVIQEANPVYALDWSPDGTQLAYGGANGTVEIAPAPSVSARLSSSACSR